MHIYIYTYIRAADGGRDKTEKEKRALRCELPRVMCVRFGSPSFMKHYDIDDSSSIHIYIYTYKHILYILHYIHTNITYTYYVD